MEQQDWNLDLLPQGQMLFPPQHMALSDANASLVSPVRLETE